MKFEKVIAEFPVTVYGNLEQYNNTLSKARCRIFYKGPNRNGTFITDEFAEKLLSSLPYTPVKGIYDNFEEDYTDHGAKRELGRIYGIVPENPHIAWETFLDEDGIERTYACTDVLLFTALYGEANEIVGKAQSMELYEPSINGEFKFIQGRKYYVFTEGSFLGLQVLGEDVEPCFEGAAFFQLMDRLQEALDKIEEYNLNTINSDNGGNGMYKINFRLSDGEKFDFIWNLLNPAFNEEGNWTVDYSVCDVYDDYALAYKFEDSTYWRVYYTKEDDTVTLGEMVQCYIVDVTESEKQTLAAVQALNGGNFENLDNVFTEKQAAEEKNIEFEQKIEEFNTSISTLQSEKDELTNSLNDVNAEFSALKEETESLKSFKLAKETEEKMAVIEKYAFQLDEEVINKYKEKVADFTKADLEKELAFELVQSKPSIFTIQGQFGLIPNEGQSTGTLAEVLEKYRK